MRLQLADRTQHLGGGLGSRASDGHRGAAGGGALGPRTRRARELVGPRHRGGRDRRRLAARPPGHGDRRARQRPETARPASADRRRQRMIQTDAADQPRQLGWPARRPRRSGRRRQHRDREPREGRARGRSASGSRCRSTGRSTSPSGSSTAADRAFVEMPRHADGSRRRSACRGTSTPAVVVGAQRGDPRAPPGRSSLCGRGSRRRCPGFVPHPPAAPPTSHVPISDEDPRTAWGLRHWCARGDLNPHALSDTGT